MRSVTGLTLIELLVAVAILALLSVLSWRTLEGMLRTRALTQSHAAAGLQWQSAVAQWSADLDALRETGIRPALFFDGLSMRMVRQPPLAPEGMGAGLVVVAWTVKPGPDNTAQARWVRWASPVLQTRPALEAAWEAADVWARASVLRPQDQVTWLPPVQGWQLFYHRGDGWSHPLSAADPETPSLPQGVRLVLALPSSGVLTGSLVRDWVRPTVGGGKAL
jgi:general secretion pathway protein J